ncbi:MAG TPA: hypothetical protein VML54_01285, partial [Candidatus Limnocylindrales bacterium]|nr:hypothetical protein [Candidatus Limnocylindrales bacterium]
MRAVVPGLSFKGPFPEKAAFTLEMPADLKDDAGRPLANARRFPLAVKTEAFPPLAKFPARFGIVELTGDAALPVTLRNVEPALVARMVAIPGSPKGFREWVRGRLFRIPPERAPEILPWIRRVAEADRETSIFPAGSAVTPSQFSLPKPAGAQPMEVVGIPLREAGFYVVEIESARLGASLLGKARPMYVPAAALVTNLSVHLKWGRESSLVWVTTLDSARPVGSARVAVRDCAGKVLWQGATDGQGIARIDRLPASRDLAHCPPADGRLIVQASAADGLGNPTAAHGEVWVAGSEDWWFEARDSDRIDLLPERRRYEPGETARFQVRMPFRAATALVTVEREGILDARVVSLSGTEPVIDVPVSAAWAPNVFVSALVVRGRVGGVQPTALVDLGRPAFKLGVSEIRVGWRAHELKVTVTADRPVYRTREKARVTVAVRTAGGAVPPAGSEIAVAAVDEGLLELLPNPSFTLLDAMMRRRAYRVTTSTAQSHVIGKRHFGLKAVVAGGAGGQRPTRELFDTLLYWKARVPLDARGEAVLEVPLNDSITAFRIVAVASG